MIAVRGAITILDNSKDTIINDTEVLLKEVIKKNDIDKNSIISIIFSATKDITKIYPAIAARNLGIVNAGLLCVQEMDVEGSMRKCIRILMYVDTNNTQMDIHHIYLREATKLRPDLR